MCFRARAPVEAAGQVPGTPEVKLQGDLDPGAGTIRVVPADLGRIVAQLTHNSCEAVAEKNGTEAPGNRYRPILQITTRRDGAHVEITT